MDADRSLPTDPAWREKVEETIERLEARAARGEQFARLALPGWYAELKTVNEAPAYWGTENERTPAAAEQASYI